MALALISIWLLAGLIVALIVGPILKQRRISQSVAVFPPVVGGSAGQHNAGWPASLTAPGLARVRNSGERVNARNREVSVRSALHASINSEEFSREIGKIGQGRGYV